jgi:Ni,Fe-hydrogenase III component G
MLADNALKAAEDLLGQWAVTMYRSKPHRLDLQLAPMHLLPATTALSAAHWGYLAAITGLDLGVAAGEIEVLYHFCAGAALLTLRVRTPRRAAHVSSICNVIPSAGFFERELIEMFGVTVEGTPDSSRLFLPDDWPAGVYPLRKDFVGQEVKA